MATKQNLLYLEVIRIMAKTETLTIKVSPEEKEKIKMLAAEKEWTVSKYLYKILFESEEKD